MEIGTETKFTGVFGYPISHTISPAFQNAGFNALKLNFVYLPFLVIPEKLSSAIEAIKTLNFVGINLTIPHKEKVISFLDKVSEEAKKVGSVNTILNKRGKLYGFTTDGEGFIRSLQEEGKFRVKGKNIFLIGTGGVGRTIAFSLLGKGCKKLFLTNRTKKRAEMLLKELKRKFGKERIGLADFEERNSFQFLNTIDLLINATSSGMKSKDSPLIKVKKLPSQLFVYDVIYNRKTALIELSKKSRVGHLDGLSMLIFQGALSFEIWTGKKASTKIMKEAGRKALSIKIKNFVGSIS